MKSIRIIESIKTLRSKKRIFFSLLVVSMILLSGQAFAQGVGIGATSFTPDASAILELRSITKGFLLPRMTGGERDLIGSPLAGLTLYNSSTNSLDLYNGGWLSLAPLSSPTFTGTVTLPTPFTLGAISVTSTGTQLNYLNAATGTTGTASTNLVFSTSPTLVTPTLGDATATTLNKVTLTTPATGSTLTIADGKTLTTSNTLTFTGTDGSSIAFGTGGTATFTSNNLSVFSATTSAQLAGVLSDETGTGLSVFATGPTFTGLSSTGAVVNLNASSNFATNINTGTSTGAVSIGNTSSTSLTLESGTGGITFGNSANARTWNVGAGNAIQTVNMFNNATPANTISIGGAASTLTIGARENTIGVPYVANGDGVRFATNRVTMNYPTAPTTGLAANTVATVAQILNAGYIGFGVLAASRTLTLPTAQGAAGLVQNLPGTPAVGDVFTFMVANGATTVTRLVTLVAGAGITLDTHAIAGRTTKVFFCRVTSVAPGAETITVY
ncbi:MAG: hypothetical protein Q8L88_01605 [Bacteroidota bacterium]|nr:hypothetical protein [Bacteroidota bacterium]